MSLFGKKKGNVPDAPMDMGQGVSSNPLVNNVVALRQQGASNNQIIQELQRQGYNPQQIFDAINMAEPTNIPAGPLPGNSFPAQQQVQPDFAMPQAEQSLMPPPVYSSGGDLNKEKLEEMAEAIIDEKWEELVKSINKIIEWKGKIEGNISKMEQEIKDLREMFNQVHSSLIGKIGEYDKNIMSVGTEVKAMSQVFEKILPTFTENVSELRRIVKSTKQ